MPKVSVIIPTHNRPELLLRALNSVYAQTFTNYEIIVVDDGQAPRAYDSLVNFFLYKNLTYIETSKDAGGGVARNLGIKMAKGEFIAFLDDDDVWLPEKLSVQIELFEKENSIVGFSFTSAVIVHEHEEVVTTVKNGVHDFAHDSLSDFNGFLTVTQVVRKDVLLSVGGFDERLPSHQESELIIRMTHAGYKGLGINQPLTRVDGHMGREGIGTNMQKRIQGRCMVLDKHAKLFALYPKKQARSYFEVALWYRDDGNWEAANQYMYKAFCTAPRIRYVVHLAYTFVRKVLYLLCA